MFEGERAKLDEAQSAYEKAIDASGLVVHHNIFDGKRPAGVHPPGKEAPLAQIYRVNLTAQERSLLLALTQKGRASARKVRRAQILLAAADGHRDTTIAQPLRSRLSTIERTRQRVVDAGLEAALHEQPRPGARRTWDGKPEACLSALACREPPAGRTRWTMQRLAERLVARGMVEARADETVRRVLKNTHSSRG